MLIFGGGLWVDQKRIYQDSIYLLDLEVNDGWKLLKHIKCPMKSWCVATITSDERVHLITKLNEEDENAHYSLPVSTILGPDFIDDEDSKCDQLRTQTETLQA